MLNLMSTLPDVKEYVKKEMQCKIARSTLYTRLVPLRPISAEGLRHRHAVPVQYSKPFILINFNSTHQFIFPILDHQ